MKLDMVRFGKDYLVPEYIIKTKEGDLDEIYKLAIVLGKDFLYREMKSIFHQIDNIRATFTYRPIDYLMIVPGIYIDKLIYDGIVDVNRTEGIEKWFWNVNKAELYNWMDLINNLIKMSARSLIEWRDYKGRNMIDLITEKMLNDRVYHFIYNDFIERFIEDRCNLSKNYNILTLAILGLDYNLCRMVLKNCYEIRDYIHSSEMDRLPIVVQYMSRQLRLNGDEYGERCFRKVFEVLIKYNFPIGLMAENWKGSLLDIIENETRNPDIRRYFENYGVDDLLYDGL